jgi:signal peptidase II
VRIDSIDQRALLLAAAVIITDQLTKLWVVSVFRLYEIKEVIPGIFNLTYLTNTGAAFGFLAGEEAMWRQVFFIGVVCVALLVIALTYKSVKQQSALSAYSLSLIGSGAIGNLIDRTRLGEVIDFLDFYYKSHHWPAFNVADSAITVGACLFLLGTFIGPKQKDDKVN